MQNIPQALILITMCFLLVMIYIKLDAINDNLKK